MSKAVLITGITGFIGSHAVLKALQAGFQVVAPTRDNNAERIARCSAFNGALKSGSLILEHGGDLKDKKYWAKLLHTYQETLAYIVHTATPTPASNVDESHLRRDVIHEAGSLVTAPLQALLESTSMVKRIVFTASSTSARSRQADVATVDETSLDQELDLADIENLHPQQISEAYLYSKDYALREIKRFIIEYAPILSFDVAFVMPCWVLGPSLYDEFSEAADKSKLPLRPNGSSGIVWSIFFDALPWPVPFVCGLVHVQDVAQGLMTSLTIPLPKMKSPPQKTLISERSYIMTRRILNLDEMKVCCEDALTKLEARTTAWNPSTHLVLNTQPQWDGSKARRELEVIYQDETKILFDVGKQLRDL